MSGPKKSRAQLRREEQERIRRQREQELARKKKLEEERLKKEIEEKLRKEKLDSCKSILKNYIDKLKILKSTLSNEIQIISASNINNSSTSSYKKALSVKDKTETFLLSVENLKEDIKTLEQSISDAKNIMNLYSGLNASLKNENIANQREYIQQLNIKLNQLFNRTENVEINIGDYNRTIAELEAQLYWGELVERKISDFITMDISPNFVDYIKQQFNDLGKSHSFSDIKLFYTNKIPKIEKKIAEEIEEKKTIQENYYSIYSEYALLCEECGIEKNIYSITKNSILDMANRINKMNDYLQNKSEKEAIKKAIDEVMEELGYPVLATKYISTDDGENCKKLLVQYSNDKAVDITITANGQITMEIGIMDNVSRTPTPFETSNLCNDMQNFCHDYKIIEQKLEEKGIEFSDKNFLPPTAAYAEIIDVSEYGLELEFSQDENLLRENENCTNKQQTNYMQEDL